MISPAIARVITVDFCFGLLDFQMLCYLDADEEPRRMTMIVRVSLLSQPLEENCL